MSPPRDKSSSVVSLVLLEEESAVSSAEAGQAVPMSRQSSICLNVIIRGMRPTKPVDLVWDCQ